MAKRFLLAIMCIIAMVLTCACGSSTSQIENNAETIFQAPESAPIESESNMPVEADPVSPKEEKHVVAVIMGRARLPEISGKYNTWQNSGKDLAHNPDKVDENGLRDIASVYYPSIGLYDVTDPDYQEYMMQLCKMTYIDTINYYVSSVSDLKDGSWWGDSFKKTTLPLLEKYGLSTTARLEDPDKAIDENGDTTVLKNAFTDIIELLGDTVLKINERPVLAQFTISGITPDTVEDWKLEHFANYGVVPFFMVREASTFLADKWNYAVDGYYGWAELEDVNSLPLEYTENNGDYRRHATVEQAINNHKYYLERIKELIAEGKVTYYAEGLCPGFDDLAVWGWGTGPRKIERGESCALYEYKWQSALNNNFHMVVIPTWDDWGEATTIEPTLEYGVDYLEITREYAAEYKGIVANTASLELPGWIYKIRKTTDDEAVLSKMDEASQLIADGKFDEAEEIVTPFVTALNIPDTSKEFFNYPTTPTRPMVSEAVSPVPTIGANGEEIFNPTADTYIKISTGKQADAGAEKLIKVKSADASSLTRHAYIKFDTAKTQLTQVKKATLRLYCSFANTKPAEIESRDINLYATGSYWEEQSFSWATKPAVAEKLLDIESSIFRSNTWIEIDVTDYVNAHIGETIAFAILNEGQDTENNHLEFNSREADAYKPELVIE